MNYQRIFPKKSKILKLFSIYCLVLLLLIYAIFSSRFGWAYLPEDQVTSCIIQDVITIVAWAVICGISYYIMTKQNYYVILKDGIVHHKWTKEIKFDFKDVLYIDEEYTEKHSILLFYDNRGASFFLVLDREEKILNAMKKNATNLMDKESFKRRFPSVKM